MNAAKQSNNRIGVRLEPRLVSELTMLAEREKKTISDVMREAILTHIAKRIG